jgi:hypothetical protein
VPERLDEVGPEIAFSDLQQVEIETSVVRYGLGDCRFVKLRFAKADAKCLRARWRKFSPKFLGSMS